MKSSYLTYSSKTCLKSHPLSTFRVQQSSVSFKKSIMLPSFDIPLSCSSWLLFTWIKVRGSVSMVVAGKVYNYVVGVDGIAASNLTQTEANIINSLIYWEHNKNSMYPSIMITFRINWISERMFPVTSVVPWMKPT